MATTMPTLRLLLPLLPLLHLSASASSAKTAENRRLDADSSIVMMGRFEGYMASEEPYTHGGSFVVRQASSPMPARPTCAQFDGGDWRCVGRHHSESIQLFEGSANMAGTIIRDAGGQANASISAHTYYDHGPTGATREYGTLTFAHADKTESKLFYQGHGSSLVAGTEASGLSFGGKIYQGTGAFEGLVGEIVYVQRYLPRINRYGNRKYATYYVVLLDSEKRRSLESENDLRVEETSEFNTEMMLSRKSSKVYASNNLAMLKEKEKSDVTLVEASILQSPRAQASMAGLSKAKVLMAVITGKCSRPDPEKNREFECLLEAKRENLSTVLSVDGSDPVDFSFDKGSGKEEDLPLATWHVRVHESNEKMYGVPLWIEDGKVNFGGNTTVTYSGILPGQSIRSTHGKSISTTGLLAKRKAIVAGCVNQDISKGITAHVVMAFL